MEKSEWFKKAAQSIIDMDDNAAKEIAARQRSQSDAA